MKSMVSIGFCVILLSANILAGEWPENVKIRGDFRYRHEMIDTEASDARNRHRIRARVGIDGKVNEFTNVVVQIATGSDDPVSTNQTLDDGFSTKSIMLDLAYFKIQPEQIPGLSVTTGKFKNPFFKPGKSELVWDSDFNPEGGVANFSNKVDNITVTLIGAGLWIDERSANSDSWIAAGQCIVESRTKDNKSSLAAGGGFYNYANSKGFEPFYDSDEPMGNSMDDNDNYLVEFRILEVFAEVSHHFGDIPVTLMGDFVTNTWADSLETGWLAGARVGKTRKTGSWDFRYIYRELEKDAVVGMFTDSDFRGGGTDAKGHEIGGGYQIAKNSKFSVTYFINYIGLAGEEIDFNRLQVDLQLKF
ncbi:MAG: hypothetical protein GY839_21655 [candidate division Zixibacteria bacterium]|nr:hypothetical protein [candidate division Zixibacteria bacterium]